MIENLSVEQIGTTDINSLIEIADACGLSPWSYQNFVDELSRDDSIMLLVRADEKAAAGFVVGRILAGDAAGIPSEAEIYNIGVKEEFRHRGLGKKLLDTFIERCRSAAANAIWLEVRASNSNAFKFYERCGFQAHSTRKSFYSNPTEDAIIMGLRLSNTGAGDDPNIT